MMIDMSLTAKCCDCDKTFDAEDMVFTCTACERVKIHPQIINDFIEEINDATILYENIWSEDTRKQNGFDSMMHGIKIALYHVEFLIKDEFFKDVPEIKNYEKKNSFDEPKKTVEENQ